MIKFAVFFSILMLTAADWPGLVKLNHKYFMQAEYVTFIQALAFCEYYGMKMASITSKATNDELYELFTQTSQPHHSYWISGMYQNTTSYKGWMWLTTSERFSYTDWRSNPTVSDQDSCIKLLFTSPEEREPGLWLAELCQSVANIICELPYPDLNLNNKTG